MTRSADHSRQAVSPSIAIRAAHRRCGKTPRRLRSGFTLIEVILAIGLVTLLMAALYGAMNVYYTTALESYDEIERAQIARAILRDIARDIRSCTFVEQQTMDSDEEDDTLDGIDSDTVAPDTTEALGTYTNGLFGNENDLVLYVSRPDRDQNYIDAQQLQLATDRSSDLMILRYLLVRDGAGGLAGQLAGEPEATEINESVKGLARMAGDQLGLSNAIAMSDLDMQLMASKLIAPEVGDLKFEYFDGTGYVTEWDSTVQNAMPLAIAVELTLRTLSDPADDRQPEEQPGYLPPSTHRLVIPIPVAEPYVGEMGL